jgi:hypothetical protein
MRLKVKIAIVMNKEETAIMHDTLRAAVHRSPEQDRLLAEIQGVSEHANNVFNTYHRL